MQSIRMAVVGAGGFGRNHLRVIHEMPGAELVAVVDTDPAKAAEAAKQYGCEAHSQAADLAGKVDAAVVAVPTIAHADVGCPLLEAGIDLLVEKPIASDMDSALRLARAAQAGGRILQVGHLERFNPAVQALSTIITMPLFFEIHRMSVFSPRSLDVDVVLDLMIHDIDILLSLVGKMPEDIRAAGVAILSQKVDIANVRLAFPGGCVANLTASRVSTERVRKIRLFQPNQYISLDYQRQDVAAFNVGPDRQIGYKPLPVIKQEPLQLEIAAFLESVRNRTQPLVGAAEAISALEVSLSILAKIEEHLAVVAESIRNSSATSESSASS
ncbi:MAG: Gfo/Idh/MocA family oxidoreductase [Bryobacteraceae bacterium]